MLEASGAARPELAEFVRSALAEILTTPIDVVGDMQIALEAAFDTGPGVIVIAGTGSIAYGRDEQGTTVRAGGWGFAIGDEGSAHWIGRTAVNAVLRTADPRDATPSNHAPSDSPLATALLKAWGVRSLDDLARAANSIPPPDFAASLSSRRRQRGRSGDPGSHPRGQGTRRYSRGRHPTTSSRKDHAATVPVAMTGGVFRHAPLVRQVFYNELAAMKPSGEVNPEVVEPVEGALRMARRAASNRRLIVGRRLTLDLARMSRNSDFECHPDSPAA